MPGKPVDWVARGRAHQAEQRPVDAMLCYRRALRGPGASAAAHLHLGEVLWQLGRADEALAEWRAARSADPGWLQAHLAYIEGALARANFPEAGHAAEEALTRFPHVAPALLVSAIAALADSAHRQVPGDDASAQRLIQALTLDHGLLRVPSLAGPLATVLDALPHGPPRRAILHGIGTLVTRESVAAAVPALMLALVIEEYGRTGARDAAVRLLGQAAQRAYGAAEHDPVRRMARAATAIDDDTAVILATRYGELCANVFGLSFSLLWPQRTAGLRLRIVILIRSEDLPNALGGALCSVARDIGPAAEVTFMAWPTGGIQATTPSGADVRVVQLPFAAGAAEARYIAALDPDVLVDAIGLFAAVGPVLAWHPARAVVTLRDGPAPLQGPWTDAAVIMPELEAWLRARVVEIASAPSTRAEAAAISHCFDEAVRAHQSGDLEAASRLYDELLVLQPRHAQTLFLRGGLRRDSGDTAGAVADFTAALDAAPRFLDARVAAAQLALDLGRPDDAIRIASGHLASAPGFTALWRVLGLAHLAREEADAAQEIFEHALKLDIADGETHYNHGVALQAQRRLGDAARAYQRALAFRPDLVAADFNLGVMFQEEGNTEAAVAAYGQVLRRDPRHVTAYKNLGEVLFAAGRLDAWRENFQRFERQCPDALPMAVQALEVCQHFADFEGLERHLDGLRNERYVAKSPVELAACLEELLYLLLFFDVEPDVLQRFARTYDETARAVYGTPMPRAAERRPGRLRLGYLSADLRNHVMGKMMWSAIEHHDRARFEVFLYSTSTQEDAWTERFRGIADRFVPVAALSDRAAAERIGADDLDLLVDLSTHTRGARPGILARKPARVQITHVASAGAVGLAAIDFKLTDRFADLPENQDYTIERLLAMDGCVYPYRHIVPGDAYPVTRATLGLAADAFVIGAFVTPMKLSRRCLRLWREVLERMPRARLAISPNSAVLQASFMRLAAAAGIAADRVVLVPQGRDEHENQARYRLIDCVLDPLPFGGVNGTLEALDMGVPVVTLCGRKHGERTSYSILANLGVTDTVAQSGPEYVALALRLADDAAFAASVRERIRAGLRHSPLTDMPRHTRNLEAAYDRALALATGGSAERHEQ